MSFADDDELDAFFWRDHLLPSVTPDAIASALKGFALPMQPGRDFDWLAMAVRRALAISLGIGAGPEPTSAVMIQAELQRLAILTESTWLQFMKLTRVGDSSLSDFAWSRWDGEGGTDVNGDNVTRWSSDYRRFEAAVRETRWLADFLRQAAMAIEIPRGPWQTSENKRLRIERGYHLAPIFEAAFGQRVTANNFPNGPRGTARTPFMEFYQRMDTLAFGTRVSLNLAEVMKAACKLHRQHPAQFGEGSIPGL